MKFLAVEMKMIVALSALIALSVPSASPAAAQGTRFYVYKSGANIPLVSPSPTPPTGFPTLLYGPTTWDDSADWIQTNCECKPTSPNPFSGKCNVPHANSQPSSNYPYPWYRCSK